MPEGSVVIQILVVETGRRPAVARRPFTTPQAADGNDPRASNQYPFYRQHAYESNRKPGDVSRMSPDDHIPLHCCTLFAESRSAHTCRCSGRHMGIPTRLKRYACYDRRNGFFLWLFWFMKLRGSLTPSRAPKLFPILIPSSSSPKAGFQL